jgi:2-methylcitrate dehydratase PrpD
LALDGRRFTAAFAVGFEVGARVARAATPLHELDDQGRAARILFPGPAIGTYAACAAAAHAWGLTPAQTEQAFGICAHYVPLAVPWGGRAGAHDGSLPGIKYEDEGWVAQAGMMAARLARDGVTGSPRILDHGGGLWTSLQRAAPDVDALTEGLGRRWWLVSTSFKPWPCCRWIHYALTAFARILQPERLTAGEIEEIWFYTHPQAYTNFDRQEIGPDVVLDASFSYPHAAAMVALGVPPGPDWFASDVVRSPQAAALRRRVFVGTEPRALDPAAWGNDRGIRRVPTRAVVKARGVVFTETADTALGDPWEGAPAFTDSALIEKFRRLARSLAPASREWQARAEDSIQRLLTVDEIRDVRELTRLLSPAPEPA